MTREGQTFIRTRASVEYCNCVANRLIFILVVETSDVFIRLTSVADLVLIFALRIASGFFARILLNSRCETAGQLQFNEHPDLK